MHPPIEPQAVGRRRPVRRSVVAIALLAVLGLLVAACGSDKDSSSTAKTVPSGPAITLGAQDFPESVVLSELYQSLGARQQRVAMTAIHTDPTRIARISKEHHALIAALAEWDEEKALAILEQHLRPIVGVISRLPD